MREFLNKVREGATPELLSQIDEEERELEEKLKEQQEKMPAEGEVADMLLTEGILRQRLLDFASIADIDKIIGDLKEVIPSFSDESFLSEPENDPDIRP